MTELNTRVPPAAGAGTSTARRGAMRFSVDGWDPSYGASLELEGQLEGQLEESTARIDADVEVPAGRWRPIDPDLAGPLPDALLFVDGVRRVEAQLWIDGDAQPPDALTGEARNGSSAGEPTAALCASYAAGVVCCCAAGAHLVVTKLRRGLFSVAPHASDIRTRAGQYQAHHVRVKRAGAPVMTTLSQALQGKLAEVEAIAATEARGEATAPGGHAAGGHPADSASDLLIIDGPLRGRQHLPRVLGYIKSHHATYLPPELNALVRALAPGQRTPVFHMGTSWDRHSWYLRLPGPAGLAVGRRGARGMRRRPAGRRGDPAGRPQPALPRPVRLRPLQGLPRPAEPLPDRGPGARAAPPPRRPPPALPRPPRGRRPRNLNPTGLKGTSVTVSAHDHEGLIAPSRH